MTIPSTIVLESDVAEQLFPKLNHFIVDQQQCWLHQYAPTKHGYVVLRYHKDGEVYNYHAHRVSYTLYKGPIPEGMDVCHMCDVRSCINPDHLFLGTRSENNQDMVNKYRSKGQITPDEEGFIIILRERGFSYREIGKRLGIHYSTVGKVLKRIKQNG